MFTIFWDPGGSLSIWSIHSIWRMKKFLDDPTSRVFYPPIHLISESDPLQVCRFSRFVLFGERKMVFTTRQEEFRLVRFDEWKILRSIWHIVFSIWKLHLISDNEPLQVCRFGRFVLFEEWKISFTTWQVEFRFVRFDEWKILCSIWYIVLTIQKLHLINDNDPCKFVDSADSLDSANG